MNDQPAFTLWDRHPLLPLLRFADVEASGLHDGSYPLSFGWCGLDLKATAVLVRPAPEWTADLFDSHAEEIHGITYARAVAEGIEAGEVAALLNRELGGKAVITDNVGWDGYWTTRLADATGVAMRFGFNDLANVGRQFRDVADPWCLARAATILDAVNRAFPHGHKADEDARRMAALTRMLLDRPFAEWLLDSH
jgi:hypothetical protein